MLRGFGFSTMDNPFSRQSRSERRRRAKLEPQKLRNFRVQSRVVGIIINVTVDVFLICMGGYKKSVFSFRPPHSQFIAHPVRFFGGNLARIKRLPYLIAQYIICFFLLPSGHNSIAGLCQKELVRHRSRVTFIGRNIFSLFCFFRIFPIVQTVPDCFGNGFSLAGMTL